MQTEKYQRADIAADGKTDIRRVPLESKAGNRDIRDVKKTASQRDAGKRLAKRRPRIFIMMTAIA
ncbi:hypothetical protein [uncultured Bifidobacterium sp.]|uniref:hypothetical protein n=1 Tax=uncultured Bifidobacterium sp. TaxID=165187 RepID=UPI00260B8569|nr:hypothetical protein [uncultured Bifidobacterium sp.]